MALHTSRATSGRVFRVTKRYAVGSGRAASATSADVVADYRVLIKMAARMNSEQNLDRLLEAITTESNVLLNADRSSLYLVDAAHNEYYTKTALGVAGELRFPLELGLAGAVIREGRAINTPDVSRDSRVIAPANYSVHTLLTVPMITHDGRTIGAIQAFNKKNGIFTSHDQDVLTAFASIAGVALENAQLRHEIQRMVDSFAETLAQAIDARDVQTAGHSRRVANYACEVAREMGLSHDREKVVFFAALLHDVGKIGVPESILTKPGPLNEDELCYMRAHVVQTHEILSKIAFAEAYRDVPIIAGQHHERANGSGYPDGLHAHEIMLEAKILAVADVYDALSVKRYYRDPLHSEDALNYLRSLIGIEFDAACVAALVRVVHRLGPPLSPTADTPPMRKMLLNDKRIISVPLLPGEPLMPVMEALRVADNAKRAASLRLLGQEDTHAVSPA